MKAYKRKGFSLIELLITISIIGILFGVVIPSYKHYVIKSRRADAISTLLKIQQEQEKWRASHTSYATLSDIWSGSASLQGYYTLSSFTNVSSSTYTATATPTGAQANDTQCTSFILTETGPDVSTSTKKQCWNQ